VSCFHVVRVVLDEESMLDSVMVVHLNLCLDSE
jgi:hypothetical protein